MQQFAGRPNPEGSEPSTVDQDPARLREQVAELNNQLSVLKLQLETVNAEKAILNHQVPGNEPLVEPVARIEEEQVTHAEEKPAMKLESTEPDREARSQEVIDEEQVIKLVRETATDTPEQPSTTPDITDASGSSVAMNDEDIQRLLLEADKHIPRSDESAEMEEDVTDGASDPQDSEASEEQTHEPKVVLSFELDKTVLARVPANIAIAALAVPHRIEEDKLVCKTVQPYDYPALDVIADSAACAVVPEPASIKEVIAALRIAYSEESEPVQREAVWGIADEEPTRKWQLFRRAS